MTISGHLRSSRVCFWTDIPPTTTQHCTSIHTTKQQTLFYHDLKYTIVIGSTCVTWRAKINNVARFRQCRIMFPGNRASRDPCSRGTWCKSRDTLHLRQIFGPNAALGRTIHILRCCVMDDDTNLLHLFRYVTKQILTVSLDQHYKTMPVSCAMLPEGQHTTSQYLYNTRSHSQVLTVRSMSAADVMGERSTCAGECKYFIYS